MSPPGLLACCQQHGGEQQDDEEAGGNRNRAKTNAFNRIFESLPEWAKGIWHDRCKGGGTRSRQTEFVNSLMVKDKRGNYIADLNSRVLQEMRENFEINSKKDSQKGSVRMGWGGGV